MASKFQEGMALGKSEVFKFNPSMIKVDESNNGRAYPVSEDKVRELAISIIENTQQVPIRVRRESGSGVNAIYTVTAGYTRLKAINLINSDSALRKLAELGEGDTYPITCIISQTNNEGALIENIVENAHRNTTSPIDDSRNQERLRVLGWTEKKIADLYQITPARVSQLKGLLLLETNIQLEIHNKAISVTNGLDLANFTPEERQEIIEEVKSNGKATKKIREVKKSKKERVAPTTKEMKEFFKTSISSEVSYANPWTPTILKSFQDYIVGDMTPEDLLDFLEGLKE